MIFVRNLANYPWKHDHTIKQHLADEFHRKHRTSGQTCRMMHVDMKVIHRPMREVFIMRSINIQKMCSSWYLWFFTIIVGLNGKTSSQALSTSTLRGFDWNENALMSMFSFFFIFFADFVTSTIFFKTAHISAPMELGISLIQLKKNWATFLPKKPEKNS